MVSKKICLAASAGGHISQLMKLADAWGGQDVFYVTTTPVMKDKLLRLAPAYFVGESNRTHPLRALGVLYRCIRIVMKEKPAVVISTGALHGCLICYLAKLLCGAKVVWMDSITNVDKPSLSGRLVYPIASLYLLQWKELTLGYPRAEYVGSVV